jgi:hypothetical protein
VGPTLSWAAHGHVQVFFSFSFLFFEIGRGSCVRRARGRRKKRNVLSVDGVEMKICLFQNNNSTIHPLLTTNRKEEEECLFFYFRKEIYIYFKYKKRGDDEDHLASVSHTPHHFHIVRSINYYYYARQLSFNFLFFFFLLKKKEKSCKRDYTSDYILSFFYNYGDFLRGATSGGSREEQLVIDAQYKSITRNHPNRSCLMHFTLFNDG